jgi:alkanesulfonate monooxygenase
MTLQTYWQLDVAEDAARPEPAASASPGLFRDVRTPALNRYDYYAQVAQAAAQTGFDGLFLPHRPQSDDSTIVAAAIAREVPRLAW